MEVEWEIDADYFDPKTLANWLWGQFASGTPNIYKSNSATSATSRCALSGWVNEKGKLMHPFIISVVVLAFLRFPLSLTLLAEEPGLGLEELLSRHENSLAAIEGVKCKWSMETVNGDGASVDRFESFLTPWFEKTSRTNANGDCSIECWDGKYYQRIVSKSLDFEEFPNPSEVKAVRLDQAIAGSLPLRWRLLHKYRFLASDADVTIRELLERSLKKPTVSQIDGKYRIQFELRPPSPGGIKLGDSLSGEVYLDPDAGFAISKQVSVLSKPGDKLTQILEVLKFTEVNANAFLPISLQASLSASTGGGEVNQKFFFEYSDPSGLTDQETLGEKFFPPNTLVREAVRNEDANARCFYATQSDGALGEAIPTELEALKILAERKLNRRPPTSTGTPRWGLVMLVIMVVGGVAIFGWRRRSN